MSYRRCEKCRSWRGCRGYEWYQPFEIERNFCKSQVVFLIRHLDILVLDEYPPDPEYSGYVGNSYKPVFGPKSQTAIGLHAEITTRLSLTDNDGETLMHEVRELNAGVDQLSQSAKNALNYCCGEKRKRQKYGAWLSTRKYRGVKSL